MVVHALDASDSAILITDARRRICYVNEGFTRMFGYSPTEVLGRTPDEVLLGRHSDPHLPQTIRDALALHGHTRIETLVYGATDSPAGCRWWSTRPRGH